MVEPVYRWMFVDPVLSGYPAPIATIQKRFFFKFWKTQ